MTRFIVIFILAESRPLLYIGLPQVWPQYFKHLVGSLVVAPWRVLPTLRSHHSSTVWYLEINRQKVDTCFTAISRVISTEVRQGARARYPILSCSQTLLLSLSSKYRFEFGLWLRSLFTIVETYLQKCEYTCHSRINILIISWENLRLAI